MLKETILGIVRHVLTFGGGWFVSTGLGTEADWTTIAAAAVTLVGIIWSIWQKKQTPVV